MERPNASAVSEIIPAESVPAGQAVEIFLRGQAFEGVGDRLDDGGGVDSDRARCVSSSPVSSGFGDEVDESFDRSEQR